MIRKNWDEDCCVSFLNQVHPMNLMLWPADPFRKNVVNGVARYTIKDIRWKDEEFQFNPIYKHNKPTE